MTSMYFYRNEIIQKTPCGKGWYFEDNKIVTNIYKTITDAKNAIDKCDGNFFSTKGGIVPKRRNKPIEIIGTMTFILDSVDTDETVHSHYEYQWNKITEPAYYNRA